MAAHLALQGFGDLNSTILFRSPYSLNVPCLEPQVPPGGALELGVPSDPPSHISQDGDPGEKPFCWLSFYLACLSALVVGRGQPPIAEDMCTSCL